MRRYYTILPFAMLVAVGLWLSLAGTFLDLSPFYLEMGVGFLAVGSGFVLYSYLAAERSEQALQELHDIRGMVSRSLDADDTLRSLSSSGIVRVYENQGKALVEYPRIVQKSAHEMHILGTKLMSLLWTPHFESSTLDALSRGVTFRVLILDPDSRAAQFVAKRQRLADRRFDAEQRHSLAKWRAFIARTDSADRFQLRLYDDLPSSFLMITDDRVLFAHYLYSAFVVDVPCFEAARGAGRLYDAYLYHFETVWKQSTAMRMKK